MPARIAGACGLLAFVTFNVAWIVGGLAQPSAYSVANDDISDLGANTRGSALLGWVQDDAEHIAGRPELGGRHDEQHASVMPRAIATGTPA